MTVCRMSRTLIDGAVSRLEFEYLIGTSEGIERRKEVHALGLFTQGQMEGALSDIPLSEKGVASDNPISRHMTL